MLELVKIQSELNAPKNQKNTFWNYNYRSTEDIMSALKPLLLREGCFLTVTDDIIQVGDRFYVKATATITKGEKSVFTTAFAREPLDRKWMDSAQVTWATSSYARKYALNWLFAIDDEKDPDHSNNWKEEKKETPKKVVDTPDGWTREKAWSSPNEFCPNCWAENYTKKWTWKNGKPYEAAECWACAIRYFVNRKLPNRIPHQSFDE